MATIHWRTCTIPSAQAVSDAIDVRGYSVVGVLLPAAWTAASLTFQGSADGSNFGYLSDSTGAEISVASPGATKLVNFSASWFQACGWIRLVSGPNAAVIPQAASRSLVVILSA